MTHLARRPTLLAAALCLVAAPACAHAHLKTSMPPMNDTVGTAPSELDLSFSEGVNLKFSGLKLTGPDQTAVATGTATFGPGGDTTLVVPLATSLGSGTYKVDWHALATDGHKTSGSYTFTVKP